MAAWTLKFDVADLFGFLHLRRSAAGQRSPARREVSARRAEAMRGLFPKVSAWMARQAYLTEMGAVDRYLSQSADLADLERRIREIERQGGGAPWGG